MDTGFLELFVDVVRSGSFAAAARERSMDPSSVSRAIAALEKDFGARLLQRSTRRLSLTEEGRRFLERVEPLLSELALAREEALSNTLEPRGTLRISTSVAFASAWLVPRLSRFLTRNPEVEVDLDLSDRNVDLIAERFDLAVRLGPAQDSGLVGTRLMRTRYRVCASPGYLRKSGPIERPEDLAAHRCVCFGLPGFSTAWLFRAAGEVRTVPVTPRIVLSSGVAVHAAVRSGLGPALIADWQVSDDLAAGSLVDVLPGFAAAATSFETGAWLLYPSRSFLPSKTRAMIDFMKSEAAASSPGET